MCPFVTGFSLGSMFPRFVQLLALAVLGSFIWLNNNLVCAGTTFVHPSVNGHLGGFHLWLL